MSKKSILIVDDCRSFVTYLTLLLRKMGFAKLTLAESGPEALKLMKILTPDLVILDADMPGMSGVETLRRIRSDAETTRVPVLVIGGTPETDAECKTLRCQGHLPKPLLIGTLNRAIQEIIETSGENRRIHLRTRFEGTVVLDHVQGTETLEAVTLSEGGIYVNHPTPLPINTEVVVQLAIHGRIVTISGKVIYHKNTANRPNSRTLRGMAIEFYDLSPEDAGTLTDYITELLSA